MDTYLLKYAVEISHRPEAETLVTVVQSLPPPPAALWLHLPLLCPGSDSCHHFLACCLISLAMLVVLLVCTWWSLWGLSPKRSFGTMMGLTKRSPRHYLCLEILNMATLVKACFRLGHGHMAPESTMQPPWIDLVFTATVACEVLAYAGDSILLSNVGHCGISQPNHSRDSRWVLSPEFHLITTS